MTHADHKPFECRVPNCDKTYTHPSSLRKHMKVTHPDVDPRSLGYSAKGGRKSKEAQKRTNKSVVSSGSDSDSHNQRSPSSGSAASMSPPTSLVSKSPVDQRSPRQPNLFHPWTTEVEYNNSAPTTQSLAPASRSASNSANMSSFSNGLMPIDSSSPPSYTKHHMNTAPKTLDLNGWYTMVGNNEQKPQFGQYEGLKAFNTFLQ